MKRVLFGPVADHHPFEDGHRFRIVYETENADSRICDVNKRASGAITGVTIVNRSWASEFDRINRTSIKKLGSTWRNMDVNRRARKFLGQENPDLLSLKCNTGASIHI